jgi:pilus assembly protein CpaE
MPEKILVVDDDVDSLKLIGLMLKRQGYEVIAANAGMPALQKAYAERPDLIILDVMMPDMDGYEVCRRLRAEASTKDIPIIMFTAKTLVDDKVAGFEAGADDYLTKPTHPAELASRVKAVMTRAAQQRGTAAAGGATGPSAGLSIGFLGVKGGVGTSTLALATAGVFVREQQDTILADLRPGQGSIALNLGLSNNHQGIAQMMRYAPNDINASLLNNQLLRHASGLKLLLSSINPQESQITITPENASALLKAMSAVARYRLLDMGAGLNRATVRLVRELNLTVLITEPQRPTLMLTQVTLRELKNIGVPAAKIMLILFNRSQSNYQVAWQEVEQLLAHEVAGIISPAPELAAQAAEAHTPLTIFQPEAVVAGQITKVVTEMVKRGGA